VQKQKQRNIKDKKKENRGVVKILLIILVILCTFAIMYFLPVKEVQSWILNAGIWAPVVYIMCFTFLPVFFFPVPVLALAGGLCFGLLSGTLYTAVGAFLNSTLMFLLARYIGGDAVERLIEKNMSEETRMKFEKNNHRDLIMFIFILRLIPLVPYNVINYCSGLTKVPFWGYTLATMTGIMPGTIVFLNLGEKTTDVTSVQFAIAVLALVLLIVFSLWISKKYKEK
jgi:uncharacterized membrane protein YdjX (TVP38/TMEM64 family)